MNPNDRIFKINAQDPLEFLTYFANKYSYSTKSAHGRLNGELAYGLYEKSLWVYNLYDSQDQRLVFEFLSGRKLTVDFTIMTNKIFID